MKLACFKWSALWWCVTSSANTVTLWKSELDGQTTVFEAQNRLSEKLPAIENSVLRASFTVEHDAFKYEKSLET